MAACVSSKLFVRHQLSANRFSSSLARLGVILNLNAISGGLTHPRSFTNLTTSTARGLSFFHPCQFDRLVASFVCTISGRVEAWRCQREHQRGNAVSVHAGQVTGCRPFGCVSVRQQCSTAHSLSLSTVHPPKLSTLLRGEGWTDKWTDTVHKSGQVDNVIR